MSNVPSIWFVRHGQTDWNAQGRLQGQRDTPLNEHGRAQAAEAASRLRAVAGEALQDAEFVASPLARARETMEILRTCLDLPSDGFRTDPRLQEISFGEWEGSTWAEIRRRTPSAAAARDRDRWNYRPRGEQAESYAMLAERVEVALRTLRGPTVIVAHGGVARALLVLLGHLDPYGATRTSVRQGSVLVLDGPAWRWA